MLRTTIIKLQDIPNVGKATEEDFKIIGIYKPVDLIGKDPYKMYTELCSITNLKHDHCVIDIFISAVSFMDGGPARKWWGFTEERKNTLGVC